MLRSWHFILVVLLLLLLAAAVERAGLIQPWLLASAPALAPPPSSAPAPAPSHATVDCMFVLAAASFAASSPALAARLTLRQLLHRALGCCSAGGCLCPLALAGSLLQTAKHK